MTHLLTLRSIHHSYGGHPLLDQIDLRLAAGERVCLLGRNGEGKSTLLKIIAGEIHPDEGEVVPSGDIRVVRVHQEVPEVADGCTLFDWVAEGLGQLASAIQAYHHASVRLADQADASALEALSVAQEYLENHDGWQLEQRVETVISRLRLPPDAILADQSGGTKRRAMLARALVQNPQVLLLDEPTNHLDIEAIEQLETWLLDWPGALMFVTHDRAFMQRIATRILDLDRGRLTDWPGDYANYLRRRDERLNAEGKELERFFKLLSAEEQWIRQGIKARRTRNEGRVRALEALREQARALRSQSGVSRLQLAEAERSGQLVVEVENLGYAWGDQPLVSGFSARIMRGDRVGLCGPNGIGKTTLLQLLLGELPPQHGQVRLGTRLEILYFDQLREQLQPDRTLVETLGEGSERIDVGGRSRHVIGYLQDFLFSPERCRQPVGSLSGGERNRLLLAKLFARSCNLLVMDEPTNDLDVETLELLEERLQEFNGTLLLVSHDRAFLDNVVTSLFVFTAPGRVEEQVGGYRDWQARMAAQSATKPAAAPEPRPVAKRSKSPAATRISYKEQQELAALPGRIEAMEAACAELRGQLADPTFYREAGAAVVTVTQRLRDQESALAAAYALWETLEAKAGN